MYTMIAICTLLKLASFRYTLSHQESVLNAEYLNLSGLPKKEINNEAKKGPTIRTLMKKTFQMEMTAGLSTERVGIVKCENSIVV